MSEGFTAGAKAGGAPPTPSAGAGGRGGLTVYHLLVLVLAAAVVVWLFRVIGGWAGVLLLFAAVAFIIGSVVLGIRGRATRRYSLLWILAIAAEHGMPLATTVEAFAYQFRGAFRVRVLRLAARLAQGAKLSDALRSVHGLAPADAVMLVEVGEESGRLDVALRKAAAMQARRATVGATMASQAAYLLTVLLIIQNITFFLLYWILPRLQAIFSDFGVGLPPATQALVEVSYYFSSNVLIPAFLPLLTLALIILIPGVLASGATFDLPIVRGLFRRRHTSLILRSLSMTAAGGRPIEQGMQTLAGRYPVSWVRRALKGALLGVRRGGDWREALRRRGLIGPADYDVLVAASGVGNLPWAMDDLADAADRRLALRFAVLTQALWPVVVLAIGATVLGLAVGFFAPLVDLIGRLA